MVKQSQEITKIQNNVVGLIEADVKATDIFKNTKTLRLNKRGVSLMRKQFDNWTVDSMDINGKNLISLMRKMTYPYYVDKKVLTLFTEKDAFMAKLAGAQGWLDGK
tara:strand:- start:1426 stop:1743 length:318 start_codon:yes stop_codon:yes gene_type:complete